MNPLIKLARQEREREHLTELEVVVMGFWYNTMWPGDLNFAPHLFPQIGCIELIIIVIIAY